MTEKEQVERFRKQTENGLVACAKWLEDNAWLLSHEIAGGCRSWAVSFEAGEDGIFPEIKISVNKIDKGIIDAYEGASN